MVIGYTTTREYFDLIDGGRSGGGSVTREELQTRVCRELRWPNVVERQRRELHSNLVWSIPFKVCNNFEAKHPFTGAQNIILDVWWTTPKIVTLSGDTWVHLFEATNYMLEGHAGDHVYIEGFSFTTIDDKTSLSVSMGS